MNSRAIYLEKAQSWLPALLIFVFCFAPKLSSLFIILWLVNNLVLWFFKGVKFQMNLLSYSILAIYLLFVLGTIFTHDFNIASGILVKKLSLMVFPIIFALQKKESFQLKWFVLALLAGIVVVLTLGCIHSYKAFLENNYWSGSFNGSVFSYIHHPTYLAIFLSISILFFRVGIKQKWKGFTPLNSILWIVFICVFQYVIFSFAGILFHFLVIAYIVLNYLKQKLPKRVFPILIIAFMSLPFVGYFGLQRVKDEVNNTIGDLGIYLSKPDHIYQEVKARPYGNNVRILMWTASCQQIASQPFGTGTGNFDEAMVSRLKAKDLDEIAKIEYNSHNQFLQIGVELGILGLLALLFFLFVVFRLGIKYKNELLIFLGLSFCFNGFFESIIQQQSGIVFYVLTICLAYFITEPKSELISEEY